MSGCLNLSIPTSAPSDPSLPCILFPALHADLAFHYDGKTPEEAKAQYEKDIHAGCTMFDYEDFKVRARAFSSLCL